MNKIIQELSKRNSKKIDVFSIIGAEIKSKRLKNAQTLKDVSRDICSQSYLSKIENNAIDPNPLYINKICDRVYINETSLEKLYKLFDYIVEITECYYYNNSKEISRIYTEISEFDNYRADIIKMIYFIYYNSLDLARELSYKIMKLYKSLSEDELVYYALFRSILELKENNYISAVDVLKNLYVKDISNVFEAICYDNLLRAYYESNSKKFLFILNKSIEVQQRLLNHSKIEDIMFMGYKYFLYNKMYDEANMFYDKLKDSKYIGVVKMLNSIMNKSEIDKIDDYIKPFYQLIYLKYTDYNKFKIMANNLDKRYTSAERIYIKYLLLLEDGLDNHINECCELLNNAIEINSVHLIRLFLDVVSKKYISQRKYKSAANMYMMAIKKITNIESV